MELRTIITLLIFSSLSLIFSYHIRLPFASLSRSVECAQQGLMIMIIPSLLFRKVNFFSKNFSIFSSKEPFITSVACCWLISLYLGGLYGMTVSMLDEAWKMSTLKWLILASYSIGCYVTVVGLVLADTNYLSRYLFSMVFNDPSVQISISEVVLSMVGYIVIADYIITIGVIYMGFFAVMYYYIYLFAMSYPYVTAVGVGGFCLCNLVINVIRIIYLKPRIKEIEAEDRFRNNFPFTV
jgi:hypothetical protein